MGKKVTPKITIQKEIYDKAVQKVKDGHYAGIRSFSGLCEYALSELLKKGDLLE